MPDHASQLGELTGLDDETVKQQILPYLATFSTKQTLINHLQDLLGPGPAQRSFIQSFAEERYPSATTSKAAPSTESTKAVSVAAPAASKPSVGKKTRSKFPSKLPPPRKVDAGSFGGVGSVYRKGQDDDSLFATTLSGTSSGRVSPAPTPTSSKVEAGIPEIRNSSHLEATTVSNARLASNISAKPPAEQEFILIPTDEMKDIQHSIDLLRGDVKDDTSTKMKPCFCQGRKHALHPHVPLCLSCGLVLCSILWPSPLLLPSPPCPSCAAPILSTTSRAILLTQLELSLEALTKLHEEKIRLIREERQQAWNEKRKEVELFPELRQQMGTVQSSMGYETGATSRQTQPYNAFHERRRNLDIAMGRRVDDDNQRRSRVLRIESKGTKGKGSVTKKKKQVKTSTEGSKAIKQDHVEKIMDEQGGIESEHTEEEEEEVEIDYDYDEQADGPVADPDDDGFARHSSVFPPDNSKDTAENHSWTRQSSFLPSISYVPLDERIIDDVDDVDNDAEEEGKKRHIPGSAPKEPDSKSKNGREKGKGKKVGTSEV